MTDPTSRPTTTKLRWIDTGQPRLIPADAPIRALQTSVCRDVENECSRLHLQLRRIRGDGDGAFHTDTTGSCELWFDTHSGTIGSVRDDDEPEAAWLRGQIDDELEQWLRARWSRQREQLDEDAWRRYDWHDFRFGELASYIEVLWAAWDTLVSHEGSRYQVEDLHCLAPGCPCKNVHLVFSELRDSSLVDVGHVVVRVPKLKVIEATTPLARALWAQLRAKKLLVGELAARRKRIKAIGKAVRREGMLAGEREPMEDLASQPSFTSAPPPGAPPATRRTGVARNAPCPCGSGRKYKRCCLAKADARPGR